MGICIVAVHSVAHVSLLPYLNMRLWDAQLDKNSTKYYQQLQTSASDGRDTSIVALIDGEKITYTLSFFRTFLASAGSFRRASAGNVCVSNH